MYDIRFLRINFFIFFFFLMALRWGMEKIIFSDLIGLINLYVRLAAEEKYRQRVHEEA